MREAMVDAWLGLSDLAKKHEWRWEDGVLSTIENTDWDVNTGEPNDYGGNERCAALARQHDYRLNDAPCGISIPALCERPSEIGDCREREK